MQARERCDRKTDERAPAWSAETLSTRAKGKGHTSFQQSVHHFNRTGVSTA